MSAKPVILITDHVKNNREGLVQLLQSADAEIIEAETGSETLFKASESNHIALILLDVQLSGQDSFRVAEQLHSEKKTRYIPIIFMTGVDDDEMYTQQGYRAGAVDYMHKPVDPVVLLSKVNVFLDFWRMRNSLEREIEQRVDAEMRIQHMADHDQLTCLPNRRNLYARLTEAMQRCDRYGKRLALLFLDLDGFKRINDTLGHKCGDEVLLQIAGRYQGLIRNTDTLARFGGDEFVILLTDLDEHEQLIHKLKALLDITHNPVDLEDNKVSLGVSMGIAYYPEHGSNIEELLSNADKAMYQAKNEGRNTFRFYSNEMNESAKEKMLIEKHLVTALANNEFSLVYQPIIELQHQDVVAVEVLLRWHNPELGFVRPDIFIPIAEEIGAINDIGSWVLHESCKQLASWNRRKDWNLRMCINVSTVQFNDPEQRLLHDLNSIIDRGQIQASQLELEITEGLLLNHTNNLANQLNQLVDLNVGIAIDDFGTGYSSLSYLKKYPISTLKIDRSFIMDMPDDEDDCVLVTAILAMSHGLGLKVIAEGIENQAQLKYLAELDCDYGQGYHFNKPIDAEDFEKFMLQHAASQHDLMFVKALHTGGM